MLPRTYGVIFLWDERIFFKKQRLKYPIQKIRTDKENDELQ